MIVIGTRGSELALTQARWVANLLAANDVASRLEVIRTQGDVVQHLSLDKLEGKGFFTKEIESALQEGQIDLAVHSLKDLPTESPAGLEVVAMPQRQDARDCLIVRREVLAEGAPVLPLRPHATVGTSAVRRRAQLAFLRPDLEVLDLRGNVPTRVRRLRDGTYDAIVLAQAGLNRLGLDLGAFAASTLPPQTFVPAPGQGALALQTRAADAATVACVAPLHDAAGAQCVQAERDVLARLQGGCHVPLGAHATCDAQGWHMQIFWRSPQHAAKGMMGVRLEARAASPELLVERAVKAVLEAS